MYIVLIVYDEKKDLMVGFVIVYKYLFELY